MNSNKVSATPTPTATSGELRPRAALRSSRRLRAKQGQSRDTPAHPSGPKYLEIVSKFVGQTNWPAECLPGTVSSFHGQVYPPSALLTICESRRSRPSRNTAAGFCLDAVARID